MRYEAKASVYRCKPDMAADASSRVSAAQVRSQSPCLQPRSRSRITPSSGPSTPGLTHLDERESRIGKTRRLWYINQQIAFRQGPHKGQAAGAQNYPFTIKSMLRIPDGRDYLFMKLRDLSTLALPTSLKSDERRRTPPERPDLGTFRRHERPTIQQSVDTTYEVFPSNINCANPYPAESFS